MPAPTDRPIDRPALTERIRSAFGQRMRLVLLGRAGSGRETAVRMALPDDCTIVEWDLAGVGRVSALDRLGEKGADFVGTLTAFEKEAQEKPLALVVRNIDGCAGSVEENAVVGRLRGGLQDLQSVAVFYTVADQEFVGRHFGSGEGAFFKQAAVLDIPDLTPQELESWATTWLGVFWDSSALMRASQSAGRRAADLALLLQTMLEARTGGGRTGGRVELPDVESAVASIVRARSTCYEELCHRWMPVAQRTVLREIARGMDARSDLAMVNSTGITQSTLTSTIRSLEKQGWLRRDGSQLVIADPYLGCYLRNR